MTKYAITVVDTKTGSASAFVTRHPEKIDETEGLLEETQTMFVNEFEVEDE